MSAIDLVTVSVLQGALEGIAVEMGHKLMRTAHSSIIRESEDFGAAILTPDCEQLCESVHSTPLQSGPLPGYLRGILKAFARRGDGFVSGDVVMHNDPYAGASHGPDVAFFVPIFIDGALVAFSATAAHHVDIGALTPGSSGIVDAVDAYAEGLQFKAIKVVEQGRENAAVWQLLADNLRASDVVLGDMRAQIKAAEIGAARFRDLVGRFGLATVLDAGRAILDHSERLMRGAISALPDGIYRSRTLLDGFADDPDPRRRDLTLAVALHVEGDRITVDLEGTSPQIDDRPLNMPLEGTVDCAIWLTLKSVLLDEAIHGRIPQNSGLVRPIRIKAPPGTLANPVFPAPTIARACAGNHLADAVMKALAEVVPTRVSAGIGAPKGVAFSGSSSGRYWVHLEVFEGSYGGRFGKDGMDAVDTLYVNTRNNPIEDIETHAPLRVERYELRENEVGAGRWRGGFGAIRAFRMLAEGGLSVEGEGHRHAPWPLAGGAPGAAARLLLARADGEVTELPSKVPYRTARAQDLLVIVGGSGGGYGDPWLREPDAVARDCADGLIDTAKALADYGVVIAADGSADLAATRASRTGTEQPKPAAFEIPLEALDAEAFAPFGSVISPDAFLGLSEEKGQAALIDFDTDDDPVLLHVRFATAEPSFGLVERHLTTDQAFIPLEPAPVIMCVGLGAEPAKMRAFLMDGRQGVVLRRGVWHSLPRFPVKPGGARFLMATGRETEKELRQHEAFGGELTRTEMAALGATVRVADRHGLIGS